MFESPFARTIHYVSASIAESLARVRARIARAAAHASRDPATVTLVAVSKTFPASAVAEAYAAGQRDFGENRVEEALPKLAALGPRPGLRCHLIGHVQSRKTSDFGGEFALIHSVDTPKLATRLNARAIAQNRPPQDILLECNVSGEASKEGFGVAGWERDPGAREAFITEVIRIAALPGLRVRGLMTMAPVVVDPELARPVFASLRGLRELLHTRIAGLDAPELSMGMTDDFEAAIAEGSTLVRIGRAIFGAR
ncbi:MAG: YggS family pyridoxal phosphate-dependent enzyme [Anaerolineae bacterium]|jgi:pyridoxal phosphate enzyme (YggS family)|nr:YggS family pyridoxal phosphate-dependent enzyme [Anaerolineae bacterium]